MVEQEGRHGEQTSEELPEFMSSPGFDEYTSPRQPGFMAHFKCMPEDFVVTEIDSQKELVVLDSYVVPSSPSTSSPVNVTPAESAKKATSLRPDASRVPPLQDMVSSHDYKLMEQLAEDYKQTLVHDPDHRVELGIVNDKERRGLLHFSIRLAFPVLLSITCKTQQGDAKLYVMADSKYKRLLEILSAEEAEHVMKFVCTARAARDSYLVLAPDHSKQHRTQVHRVLSELFGNYVTTKFSDFGPHTTRLPAADVAKESPEQPAAKVPRLAVGGEGGGSPSIVLRLRSKHRKLTKSSTTSDQIFTRFTLKKRNKETLDALQMLAHLLQCSPASFQTSGIKDKRAVTTQEVTVKGVSPESLSQVRRHLDPECLDIGNFRHARQHLSVGDHSGNRFHVVLRSVHPKTEGLDFQETVSSALQSVENSGFLNYYGLQRFNRTLTMPRIGLAMMHNNPRKAVDLALLENSTLNAAVKEHIRLT